MSTVVCRNADQAGDHHIQAALPSNSVGVSDLVLGLISSPVVFCTLVKLEAFRLLTAERILCPVAPCCHTNGQVDIEFRGIFA